MQLSISRASIALTYLIINSPAYAIIGNYLDEMYHPEQTCKLEIRNNGNNSICTGTLIDSNKILSADHCFRDQQGYPLSINNATVTAHCNGYQTTASNIDIKGSESDLAIVTLSETLNIQPMKIANQNLIKSLREKNATQKYFCAFFGYGLDNNDSMGTLHGIRSIESLISKQKAFLNSINHYKNTVELLTIYSNHETYSKYASCLLEISKLPLLLSDNARESKINSILTKYNLRDDDEAMSRFTAILQTEYDKIISNQYIDFLNNSKNYFEYLESKSENSQNNKGTSGINSGDSGGTFACKVSGDYYATEWVLVGVTSYKMFFNGINIASATFTENNISGFASLLNNGNQNNLKLNKNLISSAENLASARDILQSFNELKPIRIQQDNTRVIINLPVRRQ